MIKNLLFGGVRDCDYGLGMILSESILDTYLMITSNNVISDSLKLSIENYKKGKIRGIVVNSGNANCFVENGYDDAIKICKIVSEKFNVDVENLLLFSTGIIGKKIDINRIRNLASKLSLGNSMQHLLAFADAIRTTDKRKKLSIRGNDEKFIGVAKGSGMINPYLKEATLLCFIVTNAFCNDMKEIFKETIDRTLNLIAIDSDTSTNDAAVLISTREVEVDKNVFENYLRSILEELCEKIVHDAEGATRIVEINIKNAKNIGDAKRIIKSIATSYLIKSMIYGSNPNLGRIIAAIGYSGIEFDEKLLEVRINGIQAIKSGKILEENLRTIKRLLCRKKISIEINLNIGREFAKGYTCDLSYNYVRINAFEYT